MTGSTTREPTRHGLTVASYAEITAHLRHYPPERSVQILTQRGVPKEQWDAAAAAWNQAIEEDMAHDQPRLVLSFAAAFKETHKRLQREPPAQDSSPPRASAVDRTADALPALAEDSLPFGSTPSPAFVAQMSAPATQKASWESAAVGETAAVPAIDSAPSTLPFRRTDASLAWTMEQLASISAELSVSPEQKEEIFRRYKIDEPAWQRLHAELQRRVAGDPGERARFQALLTEFRQWLLQHQRRGGHDR